MIAACPKCAARYRVAESRVGAAGARIRCARCEVIFRVRLPSEDPERPLPVASAEPSPSPGLPKAAASGNVVLWACSREAEGSRVEQALLERGFQVLRVHDGVEAMLAIQRMLPSVAILDLDLPRMNGAEICEIVKRNESLRLMPVVMVVASSRSAFLPEGDRFGADEEVNASESVEGIERALSALGFKGLDTPQPRAVDDDPSQDILDDRLGSLGEGLRPSALSSGQSVSPSPTPHGLSGAEPSVEERGTALESGDSMSDERAKAERLARVVVSDIVLYQGERFDAAAREGNLLQSLEVEIEEGRKMFRQRIDERIRDERDFLIDELNRVAEERRSA